MQVPVHPANPCPNMNLVGMLRKRKQEFVDHNWWRGIMHCVRPNFCASSVLHLSFYKTGPQHIMATLKANYEVLQCFHLLYTPALDCWDSFYMYKPESSLHIYKVPERKAVIYIYYADTTCMYLGLGFGGCPRLRQQKHRWVSICIELSLVHPCCRSHRWDVPGDPSLYSAGESTFIRHFLWTSSPEQCDTWRLSAESWCSHGIEVKHATELRLFHRHPSTAPQWVLSQSPSALLVSLDVICLSVLL